MHWVQISSGIPQQLANDDTNFYDLLVPSCYLLTLVSGHRPFNTTLLQPVSNGSACLYVYKHVRPKINQNGIAIVDLLIYCATDPVFDVSASLFFKVPYARMTKQGPEKEWPISIKLDLKVNTTLPQRHLWDSPNWPNDCADPRSHALWIMMRCKRQKCTRAISRSSKCFVCSCTAIVR